MRACVAVSRSIDLSRKSMRLKFWIKRCVSFRPVWVVDSSNFLSLACGVLGCLPNIRSLHFEGRTILKRTKAFLPYVLGEIIYFPWVSA